MEKLEFIVPWPPKELSPNARVHWATKSRKAKKHRNDCWLIASRSIAKINYQFSTERLKFKMTFIPPDRRRRDDDNLVASMKAARDGISIALGIDDKRFITEPVMSDEIGGYVKIEISELK